MASVEGTTGRDALLNAAGLKSGKVLDIGMGGCACMAFYLARKGFDVTGIDRSSHAVHRARESVKRQRLKGAFSARRADATNLPFDDGAFDVVISFHSLHHIARPNAALREMFRVCRPGGKVLIADLNPTGRKIYKHEADHDGLLRMIERTARSKSAGMQIADTRLDRLFVSRNKGVITTGRAPCMVRGKRRMQHANG